MFASAEWLSSMLTFALKLPAAACPVFQIFSLLLTGPKSVSCETSTRLTMPHNCKYMRAFTDCSSVCHSLKVLFDVNALKLVGQKQAITGPAQVVDLIADA